MRRGNARVMRCFLIFPFVSVCEWIAEASCLEVRSWCCGEVFIIKILSFFSSVLIVLWNRISGYKAEIRTIQLKLFAPVLVLEYYGGLVVVCGGVFIVEAFFLVVKCLF